MIDILKDTLSKVNEWLKFAEAKNAANVAFCSTAIFSIWRLVVSIESVNIYLRCYAVFVLVCLILALIISLSSFIPKLKPPWLHIGLPSSNDNLLYFGHACKYTPEAYLDKLYNGKTENSENYKLELLYSKQIVINSKIAYIKFKQFDVAIYFTLTAILSPIGTLIIKLM